MDRDELTAHEVREAAPAQQVGDTQADASYGLPGFLRNAVLAMGPGQADELAMLLRQFPSWRQQLCSAASHHMGLRAVRDAIDTAGAADKTDAAADPTLTSTEEIWAQHFDFQLEAARMGRRDAPKLAAMIRRLPQFRTQILRLATKTMGEEAVAEGVALAHQADLRRDHEQNASLEADQAAHAGKSQADKEQEARDARERYKSADQAETEQYKKDQATSRWLHEHRPDVLHQLSLMGRDVQKVAYLLGSCGGEARQHLRATVVVRYGESFAVDAETLADGAGDAPIDSSVITSARRYNLAHGRFVDEFNAATHDRCISADGQLDPAAVWHWQEEHGIGHDGRVGPQTVATATGKTKTASLSSQSDVAAHAQSPGSETDAVRPGHLKFRSTPERARIVIDGEPTGITPLDWDLAPGKHSIQMDMPGFAPESREIVVEPDHPDVLTMQLVPVGSRSTR